MQPDARAATQAAEHLLGHIAASSQARSTRYHVDPPPWVRAFLVDHTARLGRGEGTACGHLLAGGPMVQHAALWQPGVTACSWCARAGMLLDGEDEQWCGVCRTGQPGPLPDGVVQMGHLMIWFRVCEDCAAGMATLPGVN